MKKTFYHNFIPSKAEEEACKAQGIPFQPTRVLVEIKDVYPPPTLDFHNPWKIRKTLTQYEVVTGRFLVTFANTFDHIFRYWAMSMANCVVLGHKVSVVLWDVTDQNNHKTYCNSGIHFEMLPNDDFSLSCMDLFRDRGLSIDDEIGLFWDHRATLFQFKLLRKATV